MNSQQKAKKLEEDGWVKKFTIEKPRVREYIELYESLGQEVRIESVVPSEIEGCNECFKGECNKYKVIYTRKKQHSDIS
jgi:hypothetical protein